MVKSEVTTEEEVDHRRGFPQCTVFEVVCVIWSPLLSSQLPSPWASLFRAAKAFRVTWSKRKCEAFPARSPQIRHRNELTDRDWENAVHAGTRKSSQLMKER